MKNNLLDMMCLDIYLSSLNKDINKETLASLKEPVKNNINLLSWGINGSGQKVVGFVHYANIVVNLNRKNSMFVTPLNCALKAFIFALKDSAEALVLLLSK